MRIILSVATAADSSSSVIIDLKQRGREHEHLATKPSPFQMLPPISPAPKGLKVPKKVW